MNNKLTREDCILLIIHKYDELGCLPKKSDFDVETVSMIKSYFGPWPRALEKAGVKEPNFERIEKRREKDDVLRKIRLSTEKLIIRRIINEKENSIIDIICFNGNINSPCNCSICFRCLGRK